MGPTLTGYTGAAARDPAKKMGPSKATTQNHPAFIAIALTAGMFHEFLGSADLAENLSTLIHKARKHNAKIYAIDSK